MAIPGSRRAIPRASAGDAQRFFASGTRDLAEVIMMVIPEAWQNTCLGEERREEEAKG